MITSRKQFLKNAALISVGSTLLGQNLFAKRSPADNFICDIDCNFNLNNAYPGITAIKVLDDSDPMNPKSIKYGKSGTAYVDVNYEDCLGGYQSPTCNTSNYDDNLKYYVYYPDLPASTYTNCPLPAFIIAHPGGFSDCVGIDNAPGVDRICREMALRGQVCFSIEYRRGIRLNPSINDPDYITLQQLLGYYRGCQDYRGAIRSIVKRHQVVSSRYPFSIDKNKIFLGGVSAGSFAMLNRLLFQNQALFNAILPGLNAKMGNLNIDLYYGGLGITDYTIVAALNCWGNFYIPPSNITDIPGFFLQYLSPSDFIPTISFQGKQDKVAFPNTENLYYPPGTTSQSKYRTESGCVFTNGGTYTLPAGSKETASITACGAEALHDLLSNSQINKPNELYEDCSMAHGLDPNPHCNTPGCYNTDFGTGLTIPLDVYTYIAKRAAIFFQAVRTGIAPNLGQNVFTDCENTRYGCTINYSNSCSSNQCS